MVPVLAPLWLGSEAPGVADGPAALDRALRTHLAGWGADGIGPRIAPSVRLEGPEESPAAGGDPHFKHLAAVSGFCRTLAATRDGDGAAGRARARHRRRPRDQHRLDPRRAGGARARRRGSASSGWIRTRTSTRPRRHRAGNIHGMPLGIALGRERHPAFHDRRGPPWVREEDVTLIGIRLLDPGERSYLRRSSVAFPSRRGCRCARDGDRRCARRWRR